MVSFATPARSLQLGVGIAQCAQSTRRPEGTVAGERFLVCVDEDGHMSGVTTDDGLPMSAGYHLHAGDRQCLERRDHLVAMHPLRCGERNIASPSTHRFDYHGRVDGMPRYNG